MKSSLRGVQLAWAFALMLVVQPVWADVTFSDSTFNDVDWALFEFSFDTGGLVVASQLSTGGNPSAHREIVNEVNASSSTAVRSQIWGFHLRSGVSYDPQAQGGISTIDYSEDGIFIGGHKAGTPSTPLVNPGQTISPTLRQNGNFYVGPFLRLGPQFGDPSGVWLPKELAGLVESDFERFDPAGPTDPLGIPLVAGDHPDFSVTGTLLEFGFVRLTTTRVTTFGSTVISGVDNWSVNVVQACSDLDSDGFGTPGSEACPAGIQEDCNDDDTFINPEALELPGNLVDENCDGNLGDCSPCNEWRNHGEYIRCVSQAVTAFVNGEAITEGEGDALVSSAARSDVGKKSFVPPPECTP